MALSALDIYKLLPKTNCKKCGSPTCLAFAMRLLSKKASLSECPDVSNEARNLLAQAAQPPIVTLTTGTNLQTEAISLGGETVLFRHEKTFYHPAAIAVSINDAIPDAELNERLAKIRVLKFERVGEKLEVNLIALHNASGDAKKFAQVAKKCIRETGLGIILVSENIASLEEAIKETREVKPIIYAASKPNLEKLIALCRADGLPLVLKSENLEKTLKLSEETINKGYKGLILDISAKNQSQALENLTILRRLALKSFRPAGFPVICFTKNKEFDLEVLEAGTYIAKYASIVVVNSVDLEAHLALLTLRQNIYTDPQRPVTVEPKLYEIGFPGKDSPLLVTTNFSLTFYTVSPEIENSKVPSYLLVTDTEGMSVLTAWAAEKFTAETIAKAMKSSGVEEKISHRKVIIPGYVAVLSGKLE
ncbi:MAG: acetyl-CoA decarbonylase/synthase complex subunit gamma, partial [Candidatus Omnitrophica bacterium]|nr:acetyl-CoA decarbonylase/synthase complex subunit gamma [Candidatus Omnitrophota bacterium]